MSQYDNNLRGVLFANNKRTKETQPTRTGHLEINGQKYWISAWDKTSANGNQFISLSLTLDESNNAPNQNVPNNVQMAPNVQQPVQHTPSPYANNPQSYVPQQAPVAQQAPQPAPMDFDNDVPF